MDRRQRREAERRAKKSDNLNAPQLSLVPAATASAAREGCIFGARIDPASHAQFRKLLRSIHVAPDGLGADLLYLTAEFARISSFYAVSTTYAMVKLQRRHFWRIPGVEAQISQDIKKMKSSWRKRGTMCNYCRAERNSEEGAAKRCMRCMQVIYCNAECRRADWPRHSPFCQAMDLTKVPKDVLGRLLRSITSEPFMFEPIKNYVRTILRLDSMPDAGRVNRIIFTCALVQDPVHDKRGKPSRYYMLQFSKVDRYPCSPPPVEDDETEEELRRSGVDITLVFRMDIRGAEVAQSMPTTVEKTPRMDTVDECRADPVAHLLKLNLAIREDVDNCLKLRVRKSYFTEVEDLVLDNDDSSTDVMSDDAWDSEQEGSN